MPEWLQIAIVRFHYEATSWQLMICPLREHFARHGIMRRYRDRLEYHYCAPIDPVTAYELYEADIPDKAMRAALNASWRFLKQQAAAYGCDAEDVLVWEAR